MSRFRYRSAVTFVAAVAALVVAAPAFAVDNFTPAVVNTTLQAGQSTTINKTLHLDALPGAADIIIAIDTTGSMTDAIAQAKAQAIALCTNVQAQIPGARFAVMDFKDIPDRPATNGVLILTPVFTSSCAAVLAAVNTMSATGGGDFAEAYNPTFRAAWADPVLNASPQPERRAVPGRSGRRAAAQHPGDPNLRRMRQPAARRPGHDVHLGDRVAEHERDHPADDPLQHPGEHPDRVLQPARGSDRRHRRRVRRRPLGRDHRPDPGGRRAHRRGSASSSRAWAARPRPG